MKSLFFILFFYSTVVIAGDFPLMPPSVVPLLKRPEKCALLTELMGFGDSDFVFVSAEARDKYEEYLVKKMQELATAHQQGAASHIISEEVMFLIYVPLSRFANRRLRSAFQDYNDREEVLQDTMFKIFRAIMNNPERFMDRNYVLNYARRALLRTGVKHLMVREREQSPRYYMTEVPNPEAKDLDIDLERVPELVAAYGRAFEKLPDVQKKLLTAIANGYMSDKTLDEIGAALPGGPDGRNVSARRSNIFSRMIRPAMMKDRALWFLGPTANLTPEALNILNYLYVSQIR